MTEARNPEVGLLDRDRAHRIMMMQGSKSLLHGLTTWHPKIVRLLQQKNGVIIEEQKNA